MSREQTAVEEIRRLRGRRISLPAGLVGLILVVMTAAGCGYFRSGTWVDDPKNFARAWGYAKPDAVQMVHSWYRRSPHFTREESYFFQFRWHEELFRQVVGANRMQPQEASSRGPGSEPEYCVAKPASQRRETYEAWRCTGQTDCWLFRERETKDLFFYACQL